MSFNPKDHLMKMRGKDYLEVKWRIVWFREDHPGGGIVTEIVSTDPLVMRSEIFDADGRLLGTGHGTPKTQGVASKRPFEGAETAATGRALAAAGYGTQFTGEDEGEHLADAPVSRHRTPAPAQAQAEASNDLPEIEYGTAIGVKTSKGDLYINMDKATLASVVRGINTAVEKETDAQRIDELKFKKAAALCILNHDE